MLTGLPPGPSGSTIAGILLFGLSLRNAGAICSPLLMFTGNTLYGSPISSSATEILRPFGVFQVCSSMVILFPRKALGFRSSEPRGVTTRAFAYVVPAHAGQRGVDGAISGWNVHRAADRLRATPKPGKDALSKSASRARLAEIIRKRSFGRGEITLASGRKSDFYFNLKPTMLDPEGAALLAELTYEALKDDNLDFIGGLGMGAVPLAGANSQRFLGQGGPPAPPFVRAQDQETSARARAGGAAQGRRR